MISYRTIEHSRIPLYLFDSFHHVNIVKRSEKNAIYFMTSEKKWKIFRNKFTLSCSDLNSAYSQRGRKMWVSKNEFYQRIHRHS